MSQNVLIIWILILAEKALSMLCVNRQTEGERVRANEREKERERERERQREGKPPEML